MRMANETDTSGSSGRNSNVEPFPCRLAPLWNPVYQGDIRFTNVTGCPPRYSVQTRLGAPQPEWVCPLKNRQTRLYFPRTDLTLSEFWRAKNESNEW